MSTPGLPPGSSLPQALHSHPYASVALPNAVAASDTTSSTAATALSPLASASGDGPKFDITSPDTESAIKSIRETTSHLNKLYDADKRTKNFATFRAQRDTEISAMNKFFKTDPDSICPLLLLETIGAQTETLFSSNVDTTCGIIAKDAEELRKVQNKFFLFAKVAAVLLQRILDDAQTKLNKLALKRAITLFSQLMTVLKANLDPTYQYQADIHVLNDYFSAAVKGTPQHGGRMLEKKWFAYFPVKPSKDRITLLKDVDGSDTELLEDSYFDTHKFNLGENTCYLGYQSNSSTPPSTAKIDLDLFRLSYCGTKTHHGSVFGPHVSSETRISLGSKLYQELIDLNDPLIQSKLTPSTSDISYTELQELISYVAELPHTRDDLLASLLSLNDGISTAQARSLAKDTLRAEKCEDVLGINNPGNHCYANATIQMLRSLPQTFRDYLESVPFPPDAISLSDPLYANFVADNIVHLKDLLDPKTSAKDANTALSAILKSFDDENDTDFNTAQQDPHELLTQIISCFLPDLNDHSRLQEYATKTGMPIHVKSHYVSSNFSSHRAQIGPVEYNWFDEFQVQELDDSHNAQDTFLAPKKRESELNGNGGCVNADVLAYYDQHKGTLSASEQQAIDGAGLSEQQKVALIMQTFTNKDSSLDFSQVKQVDVKETIFPSTRSDDPPIRHLSFRRDAQNGRKLTNPVDLTHTTCIIVHQGPSMNQGHYVTYRLLEQYGQDNIWVCLNDGRSTICSDPRNDPTIRANAVYAIYDATAPPVVAASSRDTVDLFRPLAAASAEAAGSSVPLPAVRGIAASGYLHHLQQQHFRQDPHIGLDMQHVAHDTIAFNEENHATGVLSNTARAPFKAKVPYHGPEQEKEFPSAEHYFHYMKLAYIEQNSTHGLLHGNDPQTKEYWLKRMLPLQGSQLQDQCDDWGFNDAFKSPGVPEWHDEGKKKVMWDALCLKYQAPHNQEFRKMINEIARCDVKVWEWRNHDQKWGRTATNGGSNLAGCLLTGLAWSLKLQTNRSDYDSNRTYVLPDYDPTLVPSGI
ncbi:MAG: hypothetical protein VW378_02355 [bacterium]